VVDKVSKTRKNLLGKVNHFWSFGEEFVLQCFVAGEEFVFGDKRE